MLQPASAVEAGWVRPIIYPLEEIVEAHHFVEAGHKRGGVAIAIR